MICLKMGSRKELDEEKRRASARMETVREPSIYCDDSVLKNVVARRDTWSDAIAELGNSLGRAVGAHHRNGAEGKALFEWMAE